MSLFEIWNTFQAQQEVPFWLKRQSKRVMIIPEKVNFTCVNAFFTIIGHLKMLVFITSLQDPLKICCFVSLSHKAL